ncbi:MAG: SGNH hydrolase [Symploca sp. SIO1B1]|nr:SGNH hydrolase [Symploca sp. SIO1B1]
MVDTPNSQFPIPNSSNMTNNPETAANSNRPLKIMPLGDSITDGYFVPGGYRINLWHHLTNRNYQIDFVGSQSNGPDVLPNKAHEGHSGWRIDEIHRMSSIWLNQFQPDIILLMIGTNDMVQKYGVEQAPERLSKLVDDIFEQLPQVQLFLASILPIGEPLLNQRVIKYNQAIAYQVEQKQAQGTKIYFADLYPTISLEDLPDGIHPNSEGFRKMALAWEEAIEFRI